MLIQDYQVLIDPNNSEIGRQRRREVRAEARRQRLVAVRQPTRSRIRRAVGLSMIRIGSRLAADRTRQWARPN
jgi:hypothetical protein